MDYQKLISRSVQITWQNPVLWLFAAITLIGLIPSWLLPTPDFTSGVTPDIAEIEAQFRTALWLTGATTLVTFLIGPISQAGVILGIHTANRGETIEARQLIKQSLQVYWKFLLIPLVIGLFFIGVVLLFGGLAFVSSVGSPLAMLCFLPLSCLLLPLSIVVWNLGIFAYNAVILEGRGVSEALSSSWKLIKSNGKEILGLTLFIGAIVLIVGIVLYAIQAVFSQLIYPSYSLMTSDPPVLIPPTPTQSLFLKLLSLPYYAVSTVINVAALGVWSLAYLELRGGENSTIGEEPAS